jgi:hypothetical protein
LKLLDWTDWLDNHIPYYEAEPLRSGLINDPPACVLLIYPSDLIRDRGNNKNGLIWDQVCDKISQVSPGRNRPIFLISDTDQIWVWAFWDQHSALFTLIQL